MCARCACTCVCVRTFLALCVYVCLYVYVSLCVYVNFGVGVFQSTVGPCVRRKLLGTETRGGLFIFALSAGEDRVCAMKKQRTKSVRLTEGRQNQFLFRTVPLKG
jgi:hypothetical protein